MNSARPLEVSLPITVKTYDIDFVGHVSNIVYLRWLEDLRLRFLDVYFPLSTQVEARFAPVLTRTEIDYRSAVRLFDSPIEGRMWLASLGRLRWELGAEILCDGTVAAAARQFGVFVNLDTSRPIRIPRELRKQYEEETGGATKRPADS